MQDTEARIVRAVKVIRNGFIISSSDIPELTFGDGIYSIDSVTESERRAYVIAVGPFSSDLKAPVSGAPPGVEHIPPVTVATIRAP
jgi:hypothetical protein